MSDKNRFKALLTENSSNNRWKNNKFQTQQNNKFQTQQNNKFQTQQNNRWKNNEDKRNAFQSKRRNKRYFGRNRITPMTNDPNFKPNLVGRGEVCFVPQVIKKKQETVFQLKTVKK